MEEEFKLSIELVPKTAWNKNVRSEISKTAWNEIRTDVCASQENKCGICEADVSLSCHEIWNYDELNHIQELMDFVALCNLCHHVKHIGYASILAKQGKLDMQEVEEHFMQINNCDFQAFKKHEVKALIQFKERSKHQWTLSFGKFESKIRGSEEEKLKKNEIVKKLREIEEFEKKVEELKVEEKKQIDQILTPEVIEKVEAIEATFSEKSKQIEIQLSELKTKVKKSVMKYGASVKSKGLQAVWSKGYLRWDTKAIEEYSTDYPEILQFRKNVKPTVKIIPVRTSINADTD